MSAAEFLRSDLEEEQQRQRVLLGVLPENMEVVRVFQRCRMELAVGMAAVYLEPPAHEIRAIVSMLRVPRDRWPYILDGVRLMGQHATEVRNAEAARKSKA
jgi:hypothetical protein